MGAIPSYPEWDGVLIIKGLREVCVLQCHRGAVFIYFFKCGIKNKKGSVVPPYPDRGIIILGNTERGTSVATGRIIRIDLFCVETGDPESVRDKYYAGRRYILSV
jgi:hypothetical protein